MTHKYSIKSMITLGIFVPRPGPVPIGTSDFLLIPHERTHRSSFIMVYGSDIGGHDISRTFMASEK